MENRPELEMKGSLHRRRSEIPQLIHDSMELVSSLHERYLWADAMCIEQNNEVQKLSQIRKMDIVYSQALLTIVALSAKDAAGCLPGVRPGTRIPALSMEEIGSIKMTARPPQSLADHMSCSVWDTRTWTFQERMLSKRCLFFADHQVYSHCHSEENIYGDLGYPDLPEVLEGQNATFNSLGYLFEEDTTVATRQTTFFRDSFRYKTWFETFDSYRRLVNQYTKRKLSHQGDALNAISGILTIFHLRFGRESLCGLPEQVFDLALLCAHGNGVEHEMNRDFPSRSWPGWTGESNYRNGPLYPGNQNDSNTTILTEISNFNYLHQTSICSVKRNLKEWGQNEQPPDLPESTAYHATLANKVNKNTLSFWAWTVPCAAFPPSSFHEVTLESNDPDKNHQDDKEMAKIYDSSGKRSGVHFGNLEGVAFNAHDSTECEYILLSKSDYPEDFLRGLADHCEVDTEQYCANLFDHADFSPSPWCLLNVMLIEWRGSYAKRVGLCQIHVEAWKKAVPQPKHILLA